MIRVIGLGEREGDLSVRSLAALKECDTILLKTALTEGAKTVLNGGFEYICLDDVYEAAEDFDSLNIALCERVLKLQRGKTAYCVPYSPESDASVIELGKRTETEIYPACGHTRSLFSAESCDYTAVSAYRLGDVDTFDFNRSAPLIVYDIDDRYTASSVKLFLGEIVGDEAECIFYNGKCERIKVYELDTKTYGYRTEVCVLPAAIEQKKSFSYYDLIEILKRLRRPDGCPWDRVQTHKSIKANLVEEAYELVEGIERDDEFMMREESGDVLMQAVFHAAIASEKGEFTYRDMLNVLCEKLIFRHSHVFGTDSAENSAGALDVWEKNKRTEKGQTSLYDTLASVPKQFPALLRLYKVLKKIKKAGESSAADADALLKKFKDAPNADSFFELLKAETELLIDAGVEPETETQCRIDALTESYR